MTWHHFFRTETDDTKTNTSVVGGATRVPSAQSRQRKSSRDRMHSLLAAAGLAGDRVVNAAPSRYFSERVELGKAPSCVGLLVWTHVLHSGTPSHSLRRFLLVTSSPLHFAHCLL